jgi:ATP-binding cassette subfamily B protein
LLVAFFILGVRMTPTYQPEISQKRLLGLWYLLRGYRLPFVLANLLVGGAAAAKIATFLLIQYFVDSVLGKTTDASQLWGIALGFVGLAALEGLCTFGSGRLAAHTAESIAQRLRNYLYDHLQKLSFTYYDTHQTGEIVQRVTSDVDELRRFYAQQSVEGGRIVLLFVIIWAVLLRLDWQLGLLSVIAIPVIVALSLFFFGKIGKRYEAYQAQEAKISTHLQENLTAVRVVKAFARQNYEKQRFAKENWRKFELGKNYAFLHALFWPISDLVIACQMAGGLTAGALFTLSGRLTLGSYLAYAWLLVWLLYPMRNLGRLITEMSTALVSYNRLTDLLVVAREPLTAGQYPSDPSHVMQGALEFRQVGLTYPGANSPALQDISFSIQPGQTVGLIGATGAGKSSLCHLLLRFYEYNSGEILLDGRPLNQYRRDYLRQQIGIVQQEAFLFSRTIRDNINFSLSQPAPEPQLYAAAQAAAVHHVILEFPQQYQTMVGERGVTLSGGQKQRLALARVLLKDPRILILDDTTSAVDAATEADIQAALQDLQKGRTTFIIAHRIQSVQAADLILVLDKGRVVQRGQHAELLAQPGLYRQIAALQSQIEAELTAELEAAAA